MSLLSSLALTWNMLERKKRPARGAFQRLASPLQSSQVRRRLHGKFWSLHAKSDALAPTARCLTGWLSIGALLLSMSASTAASADPTPEPIELVGIRPADGATIPTTPDIWVAFSPNSDVGITGTFVDENGSVVATAIVTEIPPSISSGFDIWSVTADDELTAGTAVELVLQVPFGRIDEQRFQYVVESTPRPAVILPTLAVSGIGFFVDDGEATVEFSAGLNQEDLVEDVQGFIIGQAVDVGNVNRGGGHRPSLSPARASLTTTKIFASH